MSQTNVREIRLVPGEQILVRFDRPGQKGTYGVFWLRDEPNLARFVDEHRHFIVSEQGRQALEALIIDIAGTVDAFIPEVSNADDDAADGAGGDNQAPQ